MSAHMRYLTIEQREALQEALEQRIAQLRGEIAGGLPLTSPGEQTGDEAAADLETSLEASELERVTSQVKEALIALDRLHDPAYGVCGNCGADIPYVRLLANPTATRCVACQQQREHSTPHPATL